jgi:hypothetical protein
MFQEMNLSLYPAKRKETIADVSSWLGSAVVRYMAVNLPPFPNHAQIQPL